MKKLLLVAVSVGVFLVIVVSAAILVFKPISDSKAVFSSLELTNLSSTTDPSALAKDDTFKGLLSPSTASPIQENHINIYGSPDMIMDSTEDASSKTVISVPPPRAPAIPKLAEAPPAARNDQQRTAPVNNQTRQPAPAAENGQPFSAPPAVSAQNGGRLHRDFWIQAGSFTSRERANRLKNTLDNKGLAAIITNQVVNGATFYRVRIGPYTSQNEANYWLSMIKSIDGFQDSLVWESQSLR